MDASLVKHIDALRSKSIQRLQNRKKMLRAEKEDLQPTKTDKHYQRKIISQMGCRKGSTTLCIIMRNGRTFFAKCISIP